MGLGLGVGERGWDHWEGKRGFAGGDWSRGRVGDVELHELDGSVDALGQLVGEETREVVPPGDVLGDMEGYGVISIHEEQRR